MNNPFPMTAEDVLRVMDYTPGKADATAPPFVWLQVDTNSDNSERSETISESSWGDLTWCYEPIGGLEVVYVRADAVTALVAERNEYTKRMDALASASEANFLRAESKLAEQAAEIERLKDHASELFELQRVANERAEAAERARDVTCEAWAIVRPDGITIHPESVRGNEHAAQWAIGDWVRMQDSGFTCHRVIISALEGKP